MRREMKLETTVLRAALLRLVAYNAPGTLAEIAGVRQVGDRIAEQVPDWAAGGLQLLPEGGFGRGRGDQGLAAVLELTSAELDLLHTGLTQARWNPQGLSGLIGELQALEGDLRQWFEAAIATEQWERLPEAQRKQILERQK